MRHFVFGAVLTAVALTAAPSFARDRDRDRDRETAAVTPNQIVDAADARSAQLKADLRLTPDQDKNWGSFQTTMHDMAQRRADRMTKLREQRSAQSDTTAPATTSPAASDPNARPRDDRARDDRARDDSRGRDDRDARVVDLPTSLRLRADALVNRADDMRKFADAAGPLYTSLDDMQRRRFMGFMQFSLNDDGDDMPGRRGRY